MSVDISVTGLQNASIRFERAALALPSEIKRAVRRSGLIAERKMKRNLSGPSHTKFPGNGNPYPGVVTNRLRASVTSQTTESGFVAEIGPNVEYAPYLEFGTKHMKRAEGYPFVRPTLEQTQSDIINEFEDAVRRSL